MSDDSGGGSLLGTILGLTILWALLFGVTVDGKHYGFSCTCDRGVVLHDGVPAGDSQP